MGMSTRKTIVECDVLPHIYEETNSGDICVESKEKSERRINPQYGDPVISLAELKEIANQINDYIVYRLMEIEEAHRIFFQA